MKIRSKIDWIKGYLESLENSDNISKRQFEILKEKLNSLFDEIENDYEDDENNDDDYNEEVYKRNLQKNLRSTQINLGEQIDNMPY